MDASGSILDEEFVKLKQFINGVVDYLSIGPALTHVGVIEYSKSANMELSFNTSFDKEEIKRLVNNVTHTAGITRIDLALKVASEELFTPAGGMRPTSRKVITGTELFGARLALIQPDLNTLATYSFCIQLTQD